MKDVINDLSYEVFLGGNKVASFEAGTSWEQVKSLLEEEADFSESQHSLYCVNNSMRVEIPNTSFENLPTINGKKEGEVVLLIHPKESKAGATRIELYGLVKGLIEKNPSLKTEIGNISQTPTAVLQTFFDTHSKAQPAKVAPVVKKAVEVAPKAVQSAAEMSDDELMAEFQRRQLAKQVRPVEVDNSKVAVMNLLNQLKSRSPR